MGLTEAQVMKLYEDAKAQNEISVNKEDAFCTLEDFKEVIEHFKKEYVEDEVKTNLYDYIENSIYYAVTLGI